MPDYVITPDPNPKLPKKKTSSFRRGSGGLYMVTGILGILYYWMFYDTAPEGTYNIGLLNDRLVGVLVFGLATISGSIFVSADKLLEEGKLGKTSKNRD